jgi:hypothetical protein
MILSHHLTQQLLRERQRDLLREGEERRARAAASCGAEPVEPAVERPRVQPQPQPVTECRPA